MKISSSCMDMHSSGTSFSRTERSENFNFKMSDEQRPQKNGGTSIESGKIQGFHASSQSGRPNQAITVEHSEMPERNFVESDPFILLVKALLEAMTGIKIRTIDPADFTWMGAGSSVLQGGEECDPARPI